MRLLFVSLFVALSQLVSALPVETENDAEMAKHDLESFLESVQNPEERSGKFEGDIVLGPEGRNGLINPIYNWPNVNGYIDMPYELAPDTFSLSQVEAIQRGIEEFRERTCIRLRPRTASDRDYVYVTGANSGCWSYVGRRGGRQDLNLQLAEPGVSCFRHGTIVHEFLHALGFYHEQSSPNRDDYVTIVWENIQSGTENNFNKYTTATVSNFGVGYDYDSVLHYSAYAFSINGQRTIIARDQNAVLGQRVAMSEKDVLKLNIKYECSPWLRMVEEIQEDQERTE